MDVDQLLTTTRSVRKTFDLDAPVDLAAVRDCLRIAMQAANGTNLQAWRWLVITDPVKREKIAGIYRDAYLARVGGQLVAGLLPPGSAEARLMSSTEWLVENMSTVPMLVIPCYQSTMPRIDGDESFHLATLYGSLFPAVWSFQLALHDRGYGSCLTTLHLFGAEEVRELLDIPDGVTQGCLLPVGRLPAGKVFKPAARRPIDDVVAVNGWTDATH
ncbi:nitroreductase family protein [soil metagenome]